MDINIGQVIVWVIIGLLVGSLVGRMTTRSRSGFGLVGNLVIGMLGAVVGGFLFDLLEIDFDFADLSITFGDLVSAFVGAILVVIVVRLIRR